MTAYDLAMRRWGGAFDAFLSLPTVTGARLLIEAREAETKDRIRAEWVALLPYMQSGQLKLVQFDDYFDQRTGRNIDTRPADVIIAEIEAKHGRRLV